MTQGLHGLQIRWGEEDEEEEEEQVEHTVAMELKKSHPCTLHGNQLWKNYHGVDMVSDHEKEEAKQMSQVLLTLESAAVL